MNPKTYNEAVTLMELIVVMVLVGVIIGLAVPNYMRSIERTKDEIAEKTLRYIRVAQLQFYAEHGNTYFGDATNISEINEGLGMNLMEDTGWGYNVTNQSEGFVAVGVRDSGGFNRTWKINSTLVNATCIGVCP